MVDFNINLVGMDQISGLVQPDFLTCAGRSMCPARKETRDKENNTPRYNINFSVMMLINSLNVPTATRRIAYPVEMDCLQATIFSSVLIAEDHFSSAIVSSAGLMKADFSGITLPISGFPMKTVQANKSRCSFISGPIIITP
jgi:hypothetical protein